MPRNRVLSFMTQWGPRPTTPDEANLERSTPSPARAQLKKQAPIEIDTSTPRSAPQRPDASAPASPTPPASPQSRSRADSKPRRLSMLQAYNPPQVEVASDTPPELQPIFTFLNTHSNKLYQEGYFLKLHDLDTRGRPSQDRVWSECFAQLIGTVLSLWDAAALDVARDDSEVVPTFINLSDATIKMIESLPMNGVQGGSLQNVLSISTAANNRYLLHFNTLNSLTQWTAGIRLAMFEHTSLQEAYTGSLIAGKGRNLNNIKQIMFPLKFAYEDWARVRFGAGTPWQRCWCVISPPDEKDIAKAQKAAKKLSPYEKTKIPKGDIKFYDTRKITKKTKPIATITHAFAAYAIYPQSKPLIEQSTLVKVEGLVSIHGVQESTEGFIFVMPEVHQAVTGFEIMLQWLFPAFDTFALYGRPTRLIADTLDQRGLMFAMPGSRRYGHLDILDVSGLIHTKGSQSWSERQWRKELKKLTAERMTNRMEAMSRINSQESRRRNTENTRPVVRFGDVEAPRSTPGSRSTSPPQKSNGVSDYPTPPDSAPPATKNMWSPHKRAASEAQGLKRFMSEPPDSRPGSAEGPAPQPPPHGDMPGGQGLGRSIGVASTGMLERIQSGSEMQVPSSSAYPYGPPAGWPLQSPPAPVRPPPAFTHQPSSRPIFEPFAPPELRRANSNVDTATLQEMKDAMLQQRDPAFDNGTWNGVVQQRQQNMVASQSFTNQASGVPTNHSQAMNRMQHIQRLSTIPGSPYVGSDAGSFISDEQPFLPQVDGVMEEPSPPPRGYAELASPDERPGPPVPVHSSGSVQRKPVSRPLPQAPYTEERPSIPRALTDPTNAPLGENFEHVIINEVALERRPAPFDRAGTMQTIATESSEPDYASTASASPKAKPPVERPRAGKLKTVGDPEYNSSSANPFGGLQPAFGTEAKGSSGMPDVDFGPTFDYTRTIGGQSRASPTSKAHEKADKIRSRSASPFPRIQQEINDTSTHSSPIESTNRAYFDGARTPTPSGLRTPTPSGLRTPEPLDERTIVMWPGASPGAADQNKRSLTPEEWVQQRALMAQQPQYTPPKKAIPDHVTGHTRSSSVQNPPARRKLTKTPPLSRAISGDWSQYAPTTPPPRPSSRGAGINLDTAGQTFSATEQMQFSRATGSPLINLAQNSNKRQEMQPGLVGVVSQRERDRLASKEGRNSVLVQQAIERRQQQQMQMEAEAYARQQHEMQMRQQQQLQQQQQELMYLNQQRYMQSQHFAPGLQQQQQPNYNAASAYGGHGQQQGQPQVWRGNSLQQQPQSQSQSQSQQFERR